MKLMLVQGVSCRRLVTAWHSPLSCTSDLSALFFVFPVCKVQQLFRQTKIQMFKKLAIPVLALVLIIPFVSAETERVGWYSPSCERSTLDIVWSCLSVILICTWTVSHADVGKSLSKKL